MAAFNDIVEIDLNGTKTPIHTGLFINGQFVKSKSGKTFPTINPATGDINAEVQEADKEDVDAAVAASKAALKGWSKVSGAERGKLLWKLADLIERDVAKLSALESLDNGAHASLGAALVGGAPACLRYFAGWADKIHGKVMMDEPGFMNFTRHEPYGVCGAIIPWNAPLLMLIWKLGPALACGNCITVKSSEKTPLTALQVAALVKEAGIPDGVVNIISGYGPTAGQAIIMHPDIHKVAFTGSGRTGRRLLEASAASNLKKVSLELGGKSPSIVFADADLDAAVQWTNMGMFAHNGQICVASTRVYVEESIADKFLEKYKAMTAAQRPGNQFDSTSAHGSIVDEIQFNNVMKYIETGKTEAKLIQGGNRVGEKGFFIEPTIFTEVPETAKIMREEIFGPVVAINTFKTEEDALERANNTNYGLGAAVFTRDINKAIRVSAGLQAGTVWVNCYQVVNNSTPFGGYKESGQGRELGEYALELWTQVKAVKINLS
ncbi:indole-3-acetaldehyde dehydrogenase [Hyaloraphidium curvatum]|nr:indole-3-acetaldehyde dehydrogenase [Hyaloraphidium curvatum]KAI9012295.1 indole-3-acetaldehyde dehydrogenase [Hyaloraphidium curvatum]